MNVEKARPDQGKMAHLRSTDFVSNLVPQSAVIQAAKNETRDAVRRCTLGQIFPPAGLEITHIALQIGSPFGTPRDLLLNTSSYTRFRFVGGVYGSVLVDDLQDRALMRVAALMQNEASF